MSTALLKELRRMTAQLAALTKPEPLVYTRKEAAAALRVSLAQLYRLIAAGRLVTLPSGIARDELARYVRTPQTKLTGTMSHGKAQRTATEEAQRGRDMLKALRRKAVRR